MTTKDTVSIHSHPEHFNTDGLDPARPNNRDHFQPHEALKVIRADYTLATFGEMTASGYDGAREHFEVSPEDELLAEGRAEIKREVDAITELDKMFHPESSHLGEKPRPEGDWEPLIEIDDSAKLAIRGLRGRPRSKHIRQERRKMKRGRLRELNELISADEQLAVKIETPDGGQPSPVKLVGFRNKFVVDEVSGKVFRRPVIEVQKKNGANMLIEKGAIATRVLIKQPEGDNK